MIHHHRHHQFFSFYSFRFIDLSKSFQLLLQQNLWHHYILYICIRNSHNENKSSKLSNKFNSKIQNPSDSFMNVVLFYSCHHHEVAGENKIHHYQSTFLNVISLICLKFSNIEYSKIGLFNEARYYWKMIRF